MLNVHRIKGLNIDAPLPKLVYDENEAKIAQIPGWKFFMTPHATWIPGNQTVKERVNGNVFTPNAGVIPTLPDKRVKLDTFSNGQPCISLGWDGYQSCGYCSDKVKFGDDFTFFCVGQVNLHLVEPDNLVAVPAYFFSGTKEPSITTFGHPEYFSESKQMFMLAVTTSGTLTMYAMDAQNASNGFGEIICRCSNTNFANDIGKMFSIVCSFSKEHGPSVLLNNIDVTTYKPSRENRVYSQDIIPFYFRLGKSAGSTEENIPCKYAALGMLDIDICKPENAAYLDALNEYISANWTLDEMTTTANS